MYGIENTYVLCNSENNEAFACYSLDLARDDFSHKSQYHNKSVQSIDQLFWPFAFGMCSGWFAGTVRDRFGAGLYGWCPIQSMRDEFGTTVNAIKYQL